MISHSEMTECLYSSGVSLFLVLLLDFTGGASFYSCFYHKRYFSINLSSFYYLQNYCVYIFIHIDYSAMFTIELLNYIIMYLIIEHKQEDDFQSQNKPHRNQNQTAQSHPKLSYFHCKKNNNGVLSRSRTVNVF